MNGFIKTEYYLKSLCCDTTFEDKNWELGCPHPHSPSLIRAVYKNRQIELKPEPFGLYQYADWLPVSKMLGGSAAPVTYKSRVLADRLNLKNLFITFNGYWPEKGAKMKTGTFKECEAFAVCARVNETSDKVMVVASAGNTARAFAHVCSENNIPVLICIPYDNISALWFDKELNPCVKIIAVESGADYFDAIHLSNIACTIPGFFAEGGAKNVARRDGMGTTTLSAVTTIGRIPDYYFQAIGSGTGAIAAWEANQRLIEDGRFGSNKMQLMLSQNAPFLPIKEAWDARSPEMLAIDNDIARKQVEAIDAKVLSNRKPPYSIKGGLFDALCDAGGEIFAVTNDEARAANKIFMETEGIDLEPAAACAVASLIQAVVNDRINPDSTIMLNITGGGIEKFQKEQKCHFAKPLMVFPISGDEEQIKNKIKLLFE